MTACITDSFETAGTLTATDGGQAWIITGPAYSAASGKGYQSVSSTTQGFALVDLGTPNQDVTITMTLGASYAEGGLVLRYGDANNFLAMTVDRDTTFGNDRIVLERVVGGAYGLLVSYTPAGLSLGSSYTLRCVANGSSVSGYLNGSLVINQTISLAPLGTKAGFSQHYGHDYEQPDDGTSRFDDFSACSLGGWQVGSVAI